MLNRKCGSICAAARRRAISMAFSRSACSRRRASICPARHTTRNHCTAISKAVPSDSTRLSSSRSVRSGQRQRRPKASATSSTAEATWTCISGRRHGRHHSQRTEPQPIKASTTRPPVSCAVCAAGATCSITKATVAKLMAAMATRVGLGASLPARAISSSLKACLRPGYQSWLQSMARRGAVMAASLRVGLRPVPVRRAGGGAPRVKGCFGAWLVSPCRARRQPCGRPPARASRPAPRPARLRPR